MATVAVRSYRDFTTRRVVVEKAVDRRLGHESLNPPSGWKWDYRYVVEDKITETLPFPGLKKSHLLGLPRSYWQNGPISGRAGDSLKVEEIVEVFGRGKTKWAPVIHNGDVNIWRDSTYFFSDDSIVETLDSTSVDSGGRSLHVLQRTLRSGSPILATIFKRTTGEYLPWRNYSRRYRFTGILDSNGIESTTIEGDTFYWSAVDTTRREFISYVRNDSVYCLFNQNVVEQVTSLTTPLILDDFNDLEYLGDSDGTDTQKFEIDKFPVSNDSSLAIYAVDVSGVSWTEYNVVDSFSAANQVLLDADLGILTFGGTTDPTTPAPIDGLGIYIMYQAVPRIEYEEEGYSEVSVALDADVYPLGQTLNRGFVTLARAELDIDSIVLETTKSPYGGISSTYGPVYAGADYAPLLATVYSSSGEIVPDVEVSFYFETTPVIGGLGGSGDTAERRTGFDGIARTFYVPPASVDSMGFYVTSVDGGVSLQLPSDVSLTSEDDIYTYYVLKDDPLVGIPGADTDLGEVEWSSTDLNGRKVVLYEWDATAINPISGHLGAYSPTRPASITGGYVLTYSDVLATPDSTPYGSSVETGTVTFASLDLITDSSKTGPTAWDINEWNGHVVTVSALGETRRIVSNTADTLSLSSKFSALPTGGFSIAERTANLGAYWIVSDRFITVRASAYSPKLGTTVYSNLLDLRIEIPDYMKGSYISSSLQEVPFGWRIIDDVYEQASAIDGATYISINPVAGPYPIIDVIGGDTWDLYSGSIDDEPYPWWPYYCVHDEGAAAPFAHFSLFWEVG